jgi:DNA modification methylase
MKTDNKGIMSDALRRPRNIYEAALIMSTEDRHIVKPTSNAYGCPTAKESGSIHTNEKPEVMLKYFLSMFVDSRSRVFDPTCGSGSSIRAAESLGAEAALGLEFNPEFAERAQKKLLAARGLARLSSAVDAAEKLDSKGAA